MIRKRRLLWCGLVMLAVALWACDDSHESRSGGTMVEGTSTSFGTFVGVEYLKYTGRFQGRTADGRYDVPFEIVAPADPQQATGRVLVEPLHFGLASAGRDVFFTPDFLFGEGYSHAGICRAPAREDAFAEHPCHDVQIDETVDNVEILADFAQALRTDPLAQRLLGPIDWLYGFGVSNSSYPLHVLLHTPRGKGLFDLSILLSTGWPLREDDLTLPEGFPESFTPPEGAGRVLAVLTEGDMLFFSSRGLGLRITDLEHPSYRWYEIAGASHVPDIPEIPVAAGTNPLDLRPVLRALLVAGDLWVRHGVAPPASAMLKIAPEGTLDPIPVPGPEPFARDDNLNALGGIRLPEIVVGQGQYIARSIDNPFFGDFVDLQCTPLADGSVRFPTHEAYVDRYASATLALVSERFLLAEDATRLISKAQASEIGTPLACP